MDAATREVKIQEGTDVSVLDFVVTLEIGVSSAITLLETTNAQNNAITRDIQSISRPATFTLTLTINP